ncbi:PLDc N-terminal domain-containing protein [Solitalea koreensis]|uniref:Phospholipase_D-nuclease N-terminal n=1 Tax=Solitalea koreensis TaxID=543615 RepID=A0A521CHE3_9SPHI|nr:Phospholipase_D-nuclease N-terminal [Solitalea koreensis]
MNNILLFLNLGLGELIIILSIVLFFIPTVVLWIYCLLDIVRSKMSGTNVLISLLMILLFPLIGCILYLVFRNKLKEADEPVKTL